jgi:hypothetical protein
MTLQKPKLPQLTEGDHPMTAIVLDTPEKIARYRLLTLRAALRLEIAGMKRRGDSAYKILKNEGYSGTRAQVLEQLHNHLEATK